VDNQVYVITASPARNKESKYQAWGHSSVVNPWGEVIATTDETESVVTVDIDLNVVDDFRQQIPVRQQRRVDLYDVVLTRP